MTNQKILSPAMLKTYNQCKKKYFLQYIRNVYMPQTATPFEKGKNIHAIAGYEHELIRKANTTDDSILALLDNENEELKQEK